MKTVFIIEPKFTRQCLIIKTFHHLIKGNIMHSLHQDCPNLEPLINKQIMLMNACKKAVQTSQPEARYWQNPNLQGIKW